MYVQSIKSYRSSILKNDLESYQEDINIVVEDLKQISDWLIERNNEEDYSLYTDEEFQNNIFKKLKSNYIDFFE